MKSPTRVERTSDREVVVTRVIDGPPHLVFAAWTTPELFQRWWVPKSLPISLVSCTMDVRTGGSYRLVFQAGEQTMAFFGKYLEVTPSSRLVWTNEEGGEAATSVTTVTFEAQGDRTLLTMHELHPSKDALDAAIGSTEGTPESWDQLEALVATLPR